jgi:hypothetical protein
MALLSFVESAPRAYRLKASNAASPISTSSGTIPGAMLYELIPMMPEPRLRPLVERFGAMLLEIPAFAGVYGTI